MSPQVPASGSEESLASLVGRAIDDTRHLVGAEIELYKAKAGERAAAFKGAAIFFGAAAVLALAAIIALLVGLILSLQPLIGPALATAAVVVGVLIVAGVLAWIGKRQLARPLGSAS